MKQHDINGENKSEMRETRNAMNRKLRDLTRERANWRIEPMIKLLEEKSNNSLTFLETFEKTYVINLNAISVLIIQNHVFKIYLFTILSISKLLLFSFRAYH